MTGRQHGAVVSLAQLAIEHWQGNGHSSDPGSNWPLHDAMHALAAVTESMEAEEQAELEKRRAKRARRAGR